MPMIAIRVVLWSLMTAALFALVGNYGHRLIFSRLEARGEFAFYFFGVAGAFIGAIAAAAQSVVDELRKNKAESSGSKQS
jgi:hypothetical protein